MTARRQKRRFSNEETERLAGEVVGGRAKPCHDTSRRPAVTRLEACDGAGARPAMTRWGAVMASENGCGRLVHRVAPYA